MDAIYAGFLRKQLEEGMALAAESDLMQLIPVEAIAPAIAVSESADADHPLVCRYIARFVCRGLVRAEHGEIVEADEFAVGIWFPSDYARRANPFQVLSWLAPVNVWHPNISADAPVVCIGTLAAATPLTDLLYRCFEVITYQNVTMREDDALNKPACAWARQNVSRFPVDTRPLKRRTLDVPIDPVEVTS